MPWTVDLSPTVADQPASLPCDQQGLIVKSIDRMRADAFQGDVRPLKGKKQKGRYRRRVGRYRLIFVPFPKEQKVEISAILLRSEQTYR